MSRSERLSTPREIKSVLKLADGKNKTAGPILYVENGKKYYSDNESHIKIIGNTGYGKTQTCILPMVRTVLEANESCVVLDSKGIVYEQTAYVAKRNHKVHVLDFRTPSESPSSINILKAISDNIKSDSVVIRDRGRAQNRSLFTGICSGKSNEKFWEESASRFLSGLFMLMTELSDEDQINFKSLAHILDESEERYGVGTTVLHTLYNELPDGNASKRDLATYVSGPSETRGSIHSEAANSFAIFSDSEGLSNILNKSTFDLNNFDVVNPFAVYIILPDEDSVYDSIAGVILNLFTTMLIKTAEDKYAGRLPGRVNIIIDELASVGKAMQNLPQLMAASRSRNIRIACGYQADMQLSEVYGNANAATINACFGTTIAFSTNDRRMLEEYADRLGRRVVFDANGDPVREEYLATATQIGAMPRGMALIFMENNIKYFVKLPLYSQQFDTSDWQPPERKLENIQEMNESEVFSLKKSIDKIREKKRRRSREMDDPFNLFSDEKPKPKPERRPVQPSQAQYRPVQRRPEALMPNNTSTAKPNASEKCPPDGIPTFEEFVENRKKEAANITPELQEIIDKIDAQIEVLEKREKEYPRDITIICRKAETINELFDELVLNRIVARKRIDLSGPRPMIHARNQRQAEQIQRMAQDFGCTCFITILYPDD